MNHEEQENQAALYALDLLEGQELQAFENAFSRNPELVKLVKELRETQAVWTESLPQHSPPAYLKDRTLAAVDRVQDGDSKIIPLPRSWTRGWALAAAFILIFLGVFALQQNEKQVVPVTAVPAPTLLKISLAPTPDAQNPGAVSVVWHSDVRKVELLTTDLPQAPEGHDYQLWVLDADNPQPVNVSIFAPDAEGKTSRILSPVGPVGKKLNFAISLEPTGGSAQPVGKILYVGKPG